jgi:hypothetical protein
MQASSSNLLDPVLIVQRPGASLGRTSRPQYWPMLDWPSWLNPHSTSRARPPSIAPTAVRTAVTTAPAFANVPQQRLWQWASSLVVGRHPSRSLGNSRQTRTPRAPPGGRQSIAGPVAAAWMGFFQAISQALLLPLESGRFNALFNGDTRLSQALSAHARVTASHSVPRNGALHGREMGTPCTRAQERLVTTPTTAATVWRDLRRPDPFQLRLLCLRPPKHHLPVP